MIFFSKVLWVELGKGGVGGCERGRERARESERVRTRQRVNVCVYLVHVAYYMLYVLN